MYDNKAGLPTSTLIMGLVFSILMVLLFKIGVFDPIFPGFKNATESLQISNLAFFQKLEQDMNFFFNIDQVRKDNTSLKSENATLNDELTALKLKLQDYELISKQNQFNKEFVQEAVRITKFSDNQTEVYINKGLDNGIKVNDVAVLENNLLGIVTESSSNFAKVQLISNANSTVPVIIVETGSKGVAIGEKANTVEVKEIPNDKILQVNYAVVSAGTDGVVPYGLVLGKVTNVSSNPTAISQSVAIKSLVKFNDLNSIFILVKK